MNITKLSLALSLGIIFVAVDARFDARQEALSKSDLVSATAALPADGDAEPPDPHGNLRIGDPNQDGGGVVRHLADALFHSMPHNSGHVLSQSMPHPSPGHNGLRHLSSDDDGKGWPGRANRLEICHRRGTRWIRVEVSQRAWERAHAAPRDGDGSDDDKDDESHSSRRLSSDESDESEEESIDFSNDDITPFLDCRCVEDAAKGCHCDDVGVGCTGVCFNVDYDDGDVCNGIEGCSLVDGSQVDGTPLACDDGLWCNGVETCDSVLGCQPGAPVDCNDNVECTVDSCNETTDTCDNVPKDELCASLGDPCNDGVCTLSGCIFEATNEGSICDDDKNVCTTHICENGSCTKSDLDGERCDDGNENTMDDMCIDGVCEGVVCSTECVDLTDTIHLCTFCNEECQGEYIFNEKAATAILHNRTAHAINAELVSVQSEGKHNCMVELMKKYKGLAGETFIGGTGNNDHFFWPNGDRIPSHDLSVNGFRKWALAQPDCKCTGSPPSCISNQWCEASDPDGSCVWYYYDGLWDDTKCDLYKKSAIYEADAFVGCDTDSDGDGTPDCIDGCPDDDQKTEPGDCGCGNPDIDENDNGVSDCNDPTEPLVCTDQRLIGGSAGYCQYADRNQARPVSSIKECYDCCLNPIYNRHANVDDVDFVTVERGDNDSIRSCRCSRGGYGYTPYSWCQEKFDFMARPGVEYLHGTCPTIEVPCFGKKIVGFPLHSYSYSEDEIEYGNPTTRCVEICSSELGSDLAYAQTEINWTTDGASAACHCYNVGGSFSICNDESYGYPTMYELVGGIGIDSDVCGPGVGMGLDGSICELSSTGCN